MTGDGRRWGRRLAISAAVAALTAAAASTMAGARIAGPSASPAPGPGAAAGPAAAATAASRPPLKGKVVGIDPGHNGRNYTDPAFLARQVWNGREWEDCDTAGAQTNGGYTEALFNWRVAGYLRADLIKAGARVVMTRTTNSGLGPCVDRRAEIINGGRPSVAVDIHGDGGPSWGRGFAILEPVADGPDNAVVASSARLGADIRAAMLAGTTMPVSDYDGRNGIKLRADLAGLNLTKVPKILIEVGNMRNATDARMMTSAAFQQQVARVLLAAIIKFLR